MVTKLLKIVGDQLLRLGEFCAQSALVLLDMRLLPLKKSGNYCLVAGCYLAKNS